MQNVRATCTGDPPPQCHSRASMLRRRGTHVLYFHWAWGSLPTDAKLCCRDKVEQAPLPAFYRAWVSPDFRSFLHRRLGFLVKESSPNSLMTMVMLLPSDSGYKGLRSKGSCKGAILEYIKTQTLLHPSSRTGGLPNSNTGRGQQRPLPPPRYLPSLQ